MFASCSKDSADKQDVSPIGLLTAHGWRLFSYVEFGSHPLGYSVSFVQDCYKDNCWYFYKDYTYKSSTGSVKCAANESDKFGVFTLPLSGGGTIDGSAYLSFVSIQETSLVLKFELDGWGYNLTYYECH
jgi:hypothetical protein